VLPFLTKGENGYIIATNFSLSKVDFNELLKRIYDTGGADFQMRDRFGVSVEIMDFGVSDDNTARRHALGLVRSACM
jgi:hypothetical protein